LTLKVKNSTVKNLTVQIFLSSRIYNGLFFLATFGAAFPVFSDSTTTRHSLEDFVRLAEANGGALNEQKAQVLFAEARESFAQSKAWFSGKLDFMVGPAPGATGNAVDGNTDREKWGVATILKADLSQPIYTFGALSSARRAAEAGTQAERQLLERDRWKLRTQVHEYYYGFQLAFELAGVAEDLRKRLEEALRKGEENRQKKLRGAPSSSDLDKLRIYLAEVKVRESEAVKGLELARSAMAWQTGMYGQEQKPSWDRANLVARNLGSVDLSQLKSAAQERRPEIKALEYELSAREWLAKSYRSQLLPSIFMGATFSYSVSAIRDDQLSPFAYDPLNDLSGALGIGLRWDLSFFDKNSQYSMARAELIKAEGKKRHLEQGALLEIEKNFRDLEHEQTALELRQEAARFSKRVFLDSLVAFNLGTGQAQPLLEALGAHAMAEKSRFENIYHHNLAAARLEQSVGQPILPPSAP
jgi:outer membrane protein TolC